MIKTDKAKFVPLEKDEYIPYCKASKITDDTFPDLFDKICYVMYNMTDEQLKALRLKYKEV